MTAKRILIVEDEVIIAKDLEMKLNKNGYFVAAHAMTGKDAIRYASDLKPDLVLMDIKLKGDMDGIETASQIHLKFKIPVIFLTSFADETTIQRAKECYPLGYLLKPVELRELRTAIEMGLHIHGAQENLRQREIKLRSILDTALDGFIMCDIQGNFLEANNAYCIMTGFSREELLGKNIKELDVMETSDEVEQHLYGIFDQGWDRFETRHWCKDGQFVDLEISVTYNDELKNLFVFTRNISERKRAERRIFALNKELQENIDKITRLYEAEHEQRQLAETLAEASQALVSSLKMEQVLDLILDQIGRIIKYDLCNITLIEGDKSRVVRSKGYAEFDSSMFIENFIFPLSGLPIRKQIIESGEPIVVPDVKQDSRWSVSAGSAWLRSYIAVPILIQKEVIGLINVGISMPGFYTTQHVRRLEAFAYYSAIAFQNARLFENTQRTATQLEVLSNKLLEVQETERRHIARELHDEVGQELSVLKIQLQNIYQKINDDPAVSQLAECESIVDLALRQVRELSRELHPSILDDLGLAPALRWFLDRAAQLGDLSINLNVTNIAGRLPVWIELTCYRVVQEALNNITRHAKATEVNVDLWQYAGEVHLKITDNGVGFDVQNALNSAHNGSSLGLLGMQERVILVKGHLEISSILDFGTEIHARIPLDVANIPILQSNLAGK